jgi:hypothetical protein
MEIDGRIELGKQIIDKLVREKKFKTVDPTNGQDDGKEAFKKFDSRTYLGFYNLEEEGKFMFGWRTFEDNKDRLNVYRSVLETSVFNKDFSSIKKDDSPWIWRYYEGDFDQPFDKIYDFFVEKFDLLEELASTRFA